MIKNFYQYNESIKHLLVGPTEDEVWNSIKDLKLDKILIKSSIIGLLKGVKYAIENGVDTNIDNALWSSINHTNFEISKYLVEQGADINVDNGYPIKHACKVGDLDMVKFLIEHGADKNQSNGYNLVISCRNGYYDIVKYLLEKGANPKLREGQCEEYAKEKGYDDILQLLEEYIK
jgi:ankyrin repeat protein